MQRIPHPLDDLPIGRILGPVNRVPIEVDDGGADESIHGPGVRGIAAREK
jgi:hypothetical protein